MEVNTVVVQSYKFVACSETVSYKKPVLYGQSGLLCVPTAYLFVTRTLTAPLMRLQMTLVLIVRR